MRKRKIRKIGGSLFVPLSKTDLKDFGLKEGDIVDIDDLNLIPQKKHSKQSKGRKKTNE